MLLSAKRTFKLSEDTGYCQKVGIVLQIYIRWSAKASLRGRQLAKTQRRWKREPLHVPSERQNLMIYQQFWESSLNTVTHHTLPILVMSSNRSIGMQCLKNLNLTHSPAPNTCAKDLCTFFPSQFTGNFSMVASTVSFSPEFSQACKF